MRHSLERLLAVVLIIIFSPLLFGLFILVVLFDGRPFLFVQERIGINRIPFSIYKIRTMEQGKITPLGKILRSTGCDELPQLLNIANGYMQFVGPRPLTQEDVVRLGWDAPAYDRRFSVLPGMIGLAQLLSVCDKNLSLQQDYTTIEKHSLFFCVKILFIAFGVLVFGKERIKKYL